MRKKGKTTDVRLPEEAIKVEKRFSEGEKGGFSDQRTHEMPSRMNKANPRPDTSL